MAADSKAPGLLYLEAVLGGAVPPPPYATLLKMELVEVGQGTTTFQLPVTSDLYNPNAVVHGGAIASVADSAMGLAVVSTLGAEENFTTLELKVNFVRACTVDSGPLRAVGLVVHRGRQVAVTEADVFDRNNQLVARASATNLIMLMRSAEPSGAALAVPEAAPAAPAPQEEPAVAVGTTVAPAVASPEPRAPVGPALPALAKHRLRLFGGEMAFIQTGAGPPVLLLHGIPSSSYLWRDVIGPLGTRFTMIAPDLLGYGDSDKRLDAEVSVAAQARYVVALMESLNVPHASIVGHDIGGGIAQLIAADEPKRVGRLVLIDSVVDTSWPVPLIARLKDPAWDQIMVGLDLHKGFREGLEAGIVTPGRVTDELVEEYVRPFADPPGRRAYLRAARALDNRDLTSRSKEIREIRAPTLILWGANDQFQEIKWAEHLKQKLPHAVLQVVDPGGHFLPLDRPDAVAAALLQFLSE